MNPVQHDRPPRPWGAFALAAFALIYLATFYASSAAQAGTAGAGPVAGGLLTQWVGGDWSRFGILDRGPLLLTAAGILFTAYCRRPADARRPRRRPRIAPAGDRRLLRRRRPESALALDACRRPGRRTAPALGAARAGGGGDCGLGGRSGVAAVRRARNRCVDVRETASAGRTRQEEVTSPFAQGGMSRWLWPAVPFAVLIVLGGMVPPWEFDVREYHLQVPKEWFRAGRVDFMPHNVYGNMPLGAEMHALAAMAAAGGDDAWWPGAIAGKTIIACFAPLTALAPGGGRSAVVLRHGGRDRRGRVSGHPLDRTRLNGRADRRRRGLLPVHGRLRSVALGGRRRASPSAAAPVRLSGGGGRGLQVSRRLCSS